MVTLRQRINQLYFTLKYAYNVPESLLDTYDIEAYADTNLSFKENLERILEAYPDLRKYVENIDYATLAEEEESEFMDELWRIIAKAFSGEREEAINDLEMMGLTPDEAIDMIRNYLERKSEIVIVQNKKSSKKRKKRKKEMSVREQLKKYVLSLLKEMRYSSAEAKRVVNSDMIKHAINWYAEEVEAGRMSMDEVENGLKEEIEAAYALEKMEVSVEQERAKKEKKVYTLEEIEEKEEERKLLDQIKPCLPDILIHGFAEGTELGGCEVHPDEAYLIEKELVKYLKEKGKELLKANSLMEYWVGLVLRYKPYTLVRYGMRAAIHDEWDDIHHSIRHTKVNGVKVADILKGLGYKKISKAISYWIMALLDIPDSEILPAYIEADEEFERRFET